MSRQVLPNISNLEDLVHSAGLEHFKQEHLKQVGLANITDEALDSALAQIMRPFRIAEGEPREDGSRVMTVSYEGENRPQIPEKCREPLKFLVSKGFCDGLAAEATDKAEKSSGEQSSAVEGDIHKDDKEAVDSAGGTGDAGAAHGFAGTEVASAADVAAPTKGAETAHDVAATDDAKASSGTGALDGVRAGHGAEPTESARMIEDFGAMDGAGKSDGAGTTNGVEAAHGAAAPEVTSVPHVAEATNGPDAKGTAGATSSLPSPVK